MGERRMCASNWALNPKAYADFLHAIEIRYPSLRYWMIWGEPNRVRNFMPGGKKGARRYARILDTAYAELKSASPSNTVIGGNDLQRRRHPEMVEKHAPGKEGQTAEDELAWLHPRPEKAEAEGRPDRLLPLVLNDIDTLWKEIRRAYRGNAKRRPTKLWLSEWTIQTDHDSYVFDFHVSRAEQARRLKRGYKLARRTRYVQGMGWYQLIDYPPAPTNPTWGLMTYAGAHKPAFAAYRGLP